MLKTLTAVAVLAVVASVTLALTWPSASPKSDDGQITGLYENDPEGFSVVLPVGWVGTVNDTRTPLLSITTTEDVPGAAAEIWIFSQSDDSSAKAWLDSQASRLGFDDIRLSEPVLYQGAGSGHRAIMAYTQDSGNVLLQMWTVVVRELADISPPRNRAERKHGLPFSPMPTPSWEASPYVPRYSSAQRKRTHYSSTGARLSP